MSLSTPTGFDFERLRAEVRATYRRVAIDPQDIYHFHRGAAYAALYLGYRRVALDSLPKAALESFAGVGNPHRLGFIEEGSTVLDIGCGSGTDLLLAARAVGRSGRAIGVDVTPSMRALARRTAREARMDMQVDIRPGLAEDLPVNDASVDVVISNGVLNLTPDKHRAFSEIRRVLKPGGRLHLADVALDIDLHEHERMDAHLWAA